MKVALLQILPGKTTDENLSIGIAACRRAKEAGADIALFPEMWSNGYNVAEDAAEVSREAIPPDGEFVSTFAALASELQMAIGITLLEAYDPLPRNTLILLDRHGERVLTYAKVHTCEFDVEKNLTAGEDFCVAELDTAEGAVKVGAMICYDREFPESARVLMLKGAELVLVPNACPMEVNRLEQLRSRAFENMMGVATCNYPEGQPDCNGHSTAFDGIAWLPERMGEHDMCLIKAGSGEGIYIADFDLAAMRNYRSKDVFGNAYRRPRAYRALLEEEVKEPFLRDRHERYIMRCYELAIRAGKEGFDTFGALLVHNGEILEEAGNTSDYEKGLFGHAEFNLVQKCANRYSDGVLRESILYTSCAPCERCLLAIASLGVRRVVYGVSYKAFSQLTPDDYAPADYEGLLKRMNVDLSLQGPILEDAGMRVFEYWGGEYRPLNELIAEMEGIKNKRR